jgi:hypothetical protein
MGFLLNRSASLRPTFNTRPVDLVATDDDMQSLQLFDKVVGDWVLESKVPPILTLWVVDERVLNASLNEVKLWEIDDVSPLSVLDANSPRPTGVKDPPSTSSSHLLDRNC